LTTGAGVLIGSKPPKEPVGSGIPVGNVYVADAYSATSKESTNINFNIFIGFL
jgi:hypothetical protein